MNRNPFEKTEIISEIERAIQNAFPNPTRGTLIRWGAIEQVMGKSRYEPGGWHLVDLFRGWLQNAHGIVTRSESNVGLRLLTDQEALDVVFADRTRKAYRQMDRAEEELRLIRANHLTDHQRLVLARQMQATDNERKSLKRVRRSSVNQLRRDDTARLAAGVARGGVVEGY